MNYSKNKDNKSPREREAGTAIEYILLASFIALVIVISVGAIGEQVRAFF